METSEQSSDTSTAEQKQIKDILVDWFWDHYEYVIVGRRDAEFTLDVFLQSIAEGRIENPTNLSEDEIREACREKCYELKSKLRRNFWMFYDFHSIRKGVF